MVPPEASACMLWGGIHRGTIGTVDNNVQSLRRGIGNGFGAQYRVSASLGTKDSEAWC